MVARHGASLVDTFDAAASTRLFEHAVVFGWLKVALHLIVDWLKCAAPAEQILGTPRKSIRTKLHTNSRRPSNSTPTLWD